MMIDILPAQPRKGRGAVSNESGRFEAKSRHAVDDGVAVSDQDLPPLRTTVTDENPKTIIARNSSPDVPFDRSINPYRGCEHGCVYCFARPTHAYHGLSPGLDFETKLFAKPQAAALLSVELAKPRYNCQPLAMGTNTDPYQPIERRRRITREILEVLALHGHPVTIITKSNLVCRDIDILAPMAARGLATVALSVTTLDGALARRLEPRAVSPAKRLAAIRTLSDAGVPTAVIVAPVIPALTDSEMETILAAAKEAGAMSAEYILLRLPLEIAKLFDEWLRQHAPLRAEHVLSLIRDSRGGALYQSDWARRRTGSGAYAELLAKRFALARKRLGLDARGLDLRCDLFHPPPRPGDQLALF